MPRSHVSKAPPKPNGPACPVCHRATWRFNGRAWYASDTETRRRHVCAEQTAPLGPASSNGRRTPHEPSDRRAGVAVTVLVAAALAGLGGVLATRALRR